MRIKCVLYRDDEQESSILRTMPAPSSVTALRSVLEKETGRAIKLISFWNYRTSRYEALLSMNQLAQREALLRSASSAHGGDAQTHRSTEGAQSSHSGGTPGTNTTTHPDPQQANQASPGAESATYRAQLWLESTFLLVEQVDPLRDRAEFEELAQHVRHFAGNRHVSYELTRAARLKYTYLSRMFDRTRQESLHANGESVRLLFYANNAWPTTDVMRYGFLVREGLPSGFEDALRTGVSGFGRRSPSLADLTGLGVGTHTGTSYSDGMARSQHEDDEGGRTPTRRSGGAEAGRAEDSGRETWNTRRHPFTFTSSMVKPRDKKPALKGPQKVLLCEVAPGRSWVVDTPITTLAAASTPSQSRTSTPERAGAVTEPDGLENPPEGYDSIVYEELRARQTGSRHTTPEKKKSNKSAEREEDEDHAPLTQVMVALSHQALPRYLLTIEPKKPEEPPGLLRSIFGSSSRRKSGADGADDEAAGGGGAGGGGGGAQGHGGSPAPHMTDRNVRSLVRTSASPIRAYRDPRTTSQSRSPQDTPGGYLPLYSSRLHHSRLAAPSAEQTPRQGLVPPMDALEMHESAAPSTSANPGPLHQGIGGAGSSPRVATATFAPSVSDAQPRHTSPVATQHSPDPSHRSAQPLYHQQSQQRQPSINASSRGQSASPLSGNPRQRTVPPQHASLLPPSRNSSASPLRAEPQSYRDIEGNPRPVQGDDDGANRSSARFLSSSQPSPVRSPQRPQQQPQRPSMLAIPQVLRCPAHPGNLMNIYCTTCRELTCPYCASVGSHKGHEVTEAENHAGLVHKSMQALCHDLNQWLDHFTRVQRQLEAESVEAEAQQARRLHALRGQLAEVRRALDAKERLLGKQLRDQGEQLKPPVEEAAAVRTKYAEALRPLEACLGAYHAHHSPRSNTQGSPSPQAQTVSTLQFLRAAPVLMSEVESFFRGRDKQEESKLKTAIATVRAANARAEDLLSRVDTTALRQQVEALGTRAARPGSLPAGVMPVHGRLALKGSSPPSTATRRRGAALSPSRNSSPSRLRSTNVSFISGIDEWSTTSPVRGGRASPSGQHLGLGEDDTESASSPPAVNLALVERCLLDLQRGHIWAIQNASTFFCVGQTKAVCSTPFRLKGLNWELRIAAMPRPEEQRDGLLLMPGPLVQQDTLTPSASQKAAGPLSPAAGVSVKSRPAPRILRLPGQPATEDRPGVGPDGGVLTRATSVVSSAGARPEERSGTALPEPLTPPPPFQPRLLGQPPEAADEDQWLGIFLFPLGHTRRLDFRVIAFSEVSWTEWKVSGWSEAFIGKGWGLYPFLRRKDLMRIDKLARDNTVKICVSPISDLY